MSDRPKIVHTSNGKKLARMRKIVKTFCDASEKELKKLIHDTSVDYFDDAGESLLQQRKKLVASIREGMLERKDQELEIAVRAIMIWFNRLEAERKMNLEEQW